MADGQWSAKQSLKVGLHDSYECLESRTDGAQSDGKNISVTSSYFDRGRTSDHGSDEGDVKAVTAKHTQMGCPIL